MYLHLVLSVDEAFGVWYQSMVVLDYSVAVAFFSWKESENNL